jgi:hypothetical protein
MDDRWMSLLMAEKKNNLVSKKTPLTPQIALLPPAVKLFEL